MKTKDQLLREIETLKKRVEHLENKQSKEKNHSGTGTEIAKSSNAAINPGELPQFYENIIEGVQDGFWVTDKNDVIFYTNSAMEKIAGIPNEEIIGKNVLTEFPKETTEKFNKYYLEAKKMLKPVWYEVIIKTLSGRDTWQNGWIIPQIKNKKFDGITCTVRDITESKNANKVACESEEKFRNFFNTNPSATFVWRAIEDDFVLLDVNEASQEMTSRNASDFIGMRASKIYNDLPLMIEKLNECWETKEIVEFEHYYKNRNQGTYDWIEFKLAFADPDLILLYSNIITERNQAEAELKQSEEKYRVLFESANDAIFLADAETGIITDANSEAEKLLGYSRNEIIGMHQKDLHPKKQSGQAERTFNHRPLNHLTDAPPVEIFVVTNKGNQILVEIRGRIIRLKNKEFVLGIFRDISERKKAEQALKNSLTDLRLAQKIADVGNWQYNPRTDCQFWSDEVYIIHEIDQNEKPPTIDNYKKMYNPEHFEIFDDTIQSAIKNGKGYDIIFKLNFPSGKTKWVRSICQPNLQNKTEKGYFLRGTIQDITERKNIEIELANALEQAKESDRLKSVFLANMSHEIRTPMNGILGFASLLKNPELSKTELNEYVEVIEKSGGRMLSTINDLIDISRIEAGESKVVKSKFKVDEQLHYLHTFFNPEAEKRNIELILHLQKRSDAKELFTDKEKWSAILINLIKNALKYTEKGTIEFGYNLLPGKLEFYVKDTGIGIEKHRLEAIFDRFVQEDLSITKPIEGAGLGLSISKGFAELLGGNIRVESEKGVGSTFCFTIEDTDFAEIKKENAFRVKEEIQDPDVGKLKSLTILIAEDEEFSKIFFNEIFKKYCDALIFVESGKECIEHVKNNSEIDLILMDIKMRDLDGYAATKKIREFNKNVKIIAQTAYALSGDREKALEAGCDEYIAKPVDQKHLFDLMLKILP